MSELTDKLKCRIEDLSPDQMDDIGWDTSEGVLLSGNDILEIIEYIEHLEGIKEEVFFKEIRDAYDLSKYTIETFRTSDQKPNECDRAVRVTCKETGLVAECDKHRSKYHNIDSAISGIEHKKSNDGE